MRRKVRGKLYGIQREQAGREEGGKRLATRGKKSNESNATALLGGRSVCARRVYGFRFAKQRTRWRRTKKAEERVSGWFIESPRRGGLWRKARARARGGETGWGRAEGRLYSFQAQKLNLISNINLFSLRSVPLCLLRSLSSSFPRRCRAPFPPYVHSGAFTL